VIVLMALDHTRDYFSALAGVVEPTDLAGTTPALFATRWVTHLCAPVFVFLAGLGAFLSQANGKSVAEMRRFLLTRGLWLLVLEVAVITPLGWSFQWNWSLVRLQVIWVIGLSMMLLGILLPLGPRWLGALGLAMIVGHNALDELQNPVWQVLHSIQFFRPSPAHTLASLYPLVPWAGVMMAGYAAGPLWRAERTMRVRWQFVGGCVLLGLFVLLRGSGAYGDPSAFSREAGGMLSVLSFLNVSKYPPSLHYLLVTLGLAALLVAWIEAQAPRWLRPMEVFGRVPLAFYLLHLPVIHGAAVLLSYAQFGRAEWLFQDPFLLRRGEFAAPAEYGVTLPWVYVAWALIVLVLYPVCRRYAAFKRNQRHPFWSYL
jgi:uncharacterized membrane protein